MSATGYFKCYPSDFLSGIAGMTFAEIGVYAVLMMQQYDRRRPVRADLKELGWRGQMRPTSVGKIVDGLLAAGKLMLEDGCWSNPRAARELSSYRVSAEISARNGREGAEKQRGRPKQNNDLGTLEQRQTHPESRSQKPEAPNGAAPAPAHTREGTPSSQADPGRVFSETIFAAAPDMAAAAARSPSLLSFAPVYRWLANGADLELDVIPAVREYLARPKHTTPRTWDFFEAIITEYRQKRLSSPLAAIQPPEAPKSRLDENGRLRPSAGGCVWVRVFQGGAWDSFKPDDDYYRPVWNRLVARFRSKGEWSREDLGPAPGEPGCVCPADVIRYVDSGEMQRDLTPSPPRFVIPDTPPADDRWH